MARYKLRVTEVLSRTVEVEAPNADKAWDRVASDYYKGEIVLDASDYTGDTDIQLVGEVK